MNLLAFSPYVLPFAEECPDATMLHHVRQAAIEFFRKTGVWVGALQPLDGDGTTVGFPAQGPADAKVSRLLSVMVRRAGHGPERINVMSEAGAADQIDGGSLTPVAWMGADRGLLYVHPAQQLGATITAEASFKPSEQSASIPDAMFEHYAQDIALGALATLLGVPGQPWTNERAASEKAAAFRSRTTITPRAARGGFARSARVSTIRWF